MNFFYCLLIRIATAICAGLLSLNRGYSFAHLQINFSLIKLNNTKLTLRFIINKSFFVCIFKHKSESKMSLLC